MNPEQISQLVSKIMELEGLQNFDLSNKLDLESLQNIIPEMDLRLNPEIKPEDLKFAFGIVEQIGNEFAEKQLQEKRKMELQAANEKRREIESLAKLEKEKAEGLAAIQSGKGINLDSGAADELASIGGFIGGQNDALQKSMDRLVSIQERANQFLEEIARKREAITFGE